MTSAQKKRVTARRELSGGVAPSGLAALVPLLVPGGPLVLGLVLPSFMFQGDQTASRIGLGPAFWPGTMLAALSVLSAVWIGYEIWALRRAGRRSLMTAPREDGPYDMGKALIGLCGIIGYGWLLPILGFAIATSLFIALWCWFGGLRKPLVVLPVTLIGTIALLWLFMGLALMPLPRGSGVFDGFSIWLLRITGIY